MEEFDRLVLDVLRQIPEINPDGSEWKMYVGRNVYTKQYILDNWERDKKMANTIREILMHGRDRHQNA